MRETCARVLAAALMTGAVAFAVAMPALVGPGLDPSRPLTAPPSLLRRSVPVTPHKAAATRPAVERLVGAHPVAKSAADTALASVVSAPRPNLGTLQPASVGKPQGRPAPAPAPTPTPAPTPAPEPQPTPPPETDIRELASTTPAAPPPPPTAPPPDASSDDDRKGKGHWKDKEKGHDHDRWQSEDEEDDDDDNDEQESGHSCDPPAVPVVVPATPTIPAVELPEDGDHDHGKGHWKDRGGHDNQDDD
jgi:hypothetical protein